MTFTNPLGSGSNQAGPESPFHNTGPHVAPLFTRDRYGSADSTATIDSIEKEMHEEDNENPWARGTLAKEKSDEISEKQSTETATNLPATDGGYKAWSILAGAFLFEALIWGFPLSYGVFQSHYFISPTSPFVNNTSTSYVGTVSTGIFFLGAPMMTYLVESFPQHRRAMICTGWPLCIAALLSGSFARTIPALIGTQGIMYAVGELILYLPLMSIINEYFIEKRGLAFGIVTCSSGVTGIVLPFITEALLTRLGYATTLRIFALILAVTTGPLLLLLKPRLQDSTAGNVMSFQFLRQPLFWLYSLSNTAHSTALFLPGIFLPQFASALGLNSTIGALLLALLSTGQVAGQISFGFLSDRSARTDEISRLRIPLNILVLVTSFIAGLAAFTLWGLATGLGCLIPFALLFGFFANGYTALWPRMGLILASSLHQAPGNKTKNGEEQSEEKAATTTTVNPTSVLTCCSLFSFQKGLGALLAGPVSTRLLDLNITMAKRLPHYAADGHFSGIVILTGGCFMVSAILVGGWYVLPRRWRV